MEKHVDNTRNYWGKAEPPTIIFVKLVSMEKLVTYLTLLLTIIFVTKLVLSRNRNYPPAPFTLPLIGHLHLFRRPIQGLHQTLHELSLKHGPIFSFQLGCRSFLVLSSPAAVEDCVTKNDVTFANRPRSLAGDCLTYDYTAVAWAPYGQLWRSLRRLFTIELFSQKSLQKFSAVREQEVRTFVRQVLKVSNKGSKKVDLQHLFSLLTLNIVMRVVAGKQFIEEETGITDLGKQYLKEFKDMFFPSINVTMGVSDFFPILRWFGYKGLEKTLIAVHSKRDEFLQGLVEDMRQSKIATTGIDGSSKLEFGKRTNLIETLLSLQESEPENCTENVIKSIMSTLFIAGTETSAHPMKWSPSLLVYHTEVLNKVRAEIEHNVGHERLLKEDDLPKLPYLRCVIYETLRLYPALPLLLPHCSSEDCSVGGFQIPKDTTLLVNAWGIHGDPKLWDDPNRFKPERFEALSINGERIGFKFIPFGVGRRTCPGEAMAIRTVCLAIGTLIQCFDLRRDGEESLDVSSGFGLSSKMKMPLQSVCATARHDMADLLSKL